MLLELMKMILFVEFVKMTSSIFLSFSLKGHIYIYISIERERDRKEDGFIIHFYFFYIHTNAQCGTFVWFFITSLLDSVYYHVSILLKIFLFCLLLPG